MTLLKNKDKNSAVALKRSRRVRGIISLTGISTMEFAKKHNISFNTLHSWKSGSRNVSDKGASKLSLALKKEGWYCSPEWILHARGIAPVPIEDVNPEIPDSLNKNKMAFEITEDFRITKEVAFFSSLYPSNVSMVLDDNSMSPLYRTGDLIAGIPIKKEDYSTAVGFPCIVDVDGVGRICRILHKSSDDTSFVLSTVDITTNITSPIIKDPTIISLSPVIWMRRPFSGFNNETSQ